ncbi:MAG: FtsX-like permease family protein, partial [Dehalococcoidia bacterium]
AAFGASQGTSTTFYPTPAGQQPRLADSQRPRGNFVFRTDLLAHIEVIEGTAPTPRQQRRDDPIEALIGATTASEQGISVGDVLDMHPFWETQAAPVSVVVTGIAREVDPTARYWGTIEERLDARERSWPTLRLWIPSETFFGALRQSVPTVAADYLSVFHVTFDGIDSRNALDIADGLRTIPTLLNTGSQRTTYASELEGLLRGYDEKLFFTQIPLLVLMLQIGAIVAYYLVMVSTMLIERQAAEIATMRSRGATTSQLLAIYGVEGTILAAVSAAIGPALAGGIISLLGPTPAFRDLSGGGPLDVHVGTAAYALAAVGALIAFASLMIPAWRATRHSVVEFKRGVARPSQTPAFMRYYLDVVFVLVVAALFWRLSRQDELFSETIFGETQVDPILLATPAVFMVTVGVVFLRLFPLVLHALEWVVGWTR